MATRLRTALLQMLLPPAAGQVEAAVALAAVAAELVAVVVALAVSCWVQRLVPVQRQLSTTATATMASQARPVLHGN